MYGWEKSMREDRLRKNSGNQSFSSSLLDEMYRSIDGGDGKCRDVKVHKEKITKKQSGINGGDREKSSDIGDEEMASLRRACLIEKWMEKKVNEKMLAGRRSSMPGKEGKSMQYSDPVFYSSSSCSSDSSSGGFSSSETESFGAAKSRTSCFAAPRPKPVKTGVSAHLASRESQAELYPLKDGNHQRENIDEGLIKSKARAMKIYANLKKVKQPISPGGRLSSFINSLFTNGSAKKTKDPTPSCSESVERKLKSSKSSSKCSSASSFSRSCLSKSSPNSREKLNNGVKRTVRFYPVSVIVDEDSRPCGHKCIYAEDSDKIGRHEPKLQVKEKKINPRGGFSKSYQTKKNDFLAREIRAEEDCDYDDAASDSSSDLFELDHLALFKNDRFSEELPVYETTHFDRNRAIASSFIRN
ncbi:hypothetical protein RJ640_018785 [Escallonia rubra]|uniref:Protein BIG GRAIN 1-like B n=1 Tax=Escallonia rubra TaxID=112253 RepID=A0AA88S0S6_9ASTE|nr:hypothetical protein RJ640_018785 [Escallonia rubra]